MKTRIVTTPVEEVSADAIVVLHEEGGMLGESRDKHLARHLATFAKQAAEKKSRREWFCNVEAESGSKTRHLLLDSTTFGDYSPHDEPLKIAAARALRLCRDYSLTHIAFAAQHRLAAAKAAAILEGAILGDFQDARFKGDGAKKRPALQLTFVVPKGAEKETAEALRARTIVAECQNEARLLVNAPHHVIYPETLAAHAQKLADQHGLEIEILDEKKLRKQGYEPTWQVGRGSEYPPRMIVLRYKPRKARVSEHIGLVGKGITFDTGGLCIKPGDSMHRMNNDMGGAAAVLGAMEAVARLALPVRVTAVIASAHNAVDGAAYHPGCIIKARNGKTIYVENTDAEGRLVLTDAFHRAGEEKVDAIWDFATLTGSASAALGHAFGALFTDDTDLRTLLLEAGQNTGDELWPLPIAREYEASLKHHLADLNNIVPEGRGGAINAANFLKQFLPEGVRWAHMDIAGVANHAKGFRYLGAGASGFGVRLATEALRLMVQRAA